MNKLINEMVFDTKNDRWIFLKDLESGEFIYNNKEVKVFVSNTNHKFYQTKWGNTTIQSVSWNNCKEIIQDRQDNEQHYKYMEHLNHQATGEYYNDDSFNYKGD